MKRRGGRRGGNLGKVALLLGGALLVGLGIRCRPDLLLKDQGASHGKGHPESTSHEAEHPTSKAPSKRADVPTPAQSSGKGSAQAQGAGPTDKSVHLAMGTPYDSDPSDDTLLIKPQ